MEPKDLETMLSEEYRKEKDKRQQFLKSSPEEREHIKGMAPAVLESFDVHDDPYAHMMRIIFNRWKPFLLRAIYIDKGTYFSQFLKQLPITQKVLSQNLKDMQNDGLIYRNVIPEVPPRVEYRLTESGKALVSLMELIYDWGWVDMRRKGLPVDVMGEMWHGYRERDEELLNRGPQRPAEE